MRQQGWGREEGVRDVTVLQAVELGWGRGWGQSKGQGGGSVRGLAGVMPSLSCVL